MYPASSSARARRGQRAAELPARRASSTLVIRPFACRSRKILRSILSSLIRRIGWPRRLRDFVIILQAEHRDATALAAADRTGLGPGMRGSAGEKLGMIDSGRTPTVWAGHNGKMRRPNQGLGLATAVA